MVDQLEKFIGRNVHVYTIGNSFYGKLISIDDKFVVLDSSGTEAEIVKTEFITGVSVYKEKKQKTKKK